MEKPNGFFVNVAARDKNGSLVVVTRLVYDAEAVDAFHEELAAKLESALYLEFHSKEIHAVAAALRGKAKDKEAVSNGKRSRLGRRRRRRGARD